MASTKEKLLEVAFREFLMHSYRDVTLMHLVEELGLTKGAFYHYFESKQDLFKQVVDFYLEQISDIGDIQYNKSLSFADNIMQLVLKSMAIFDEIKSRYMSEVDDMNYYNFLMDATKYYPGFIDQINKVHKANEIEVYLGFIKKAKANGDLKVSVDSLALAKLIQAVFDGIGFNAFFKESPDYLHDQINESLNFIYELIKK